MTTPSPSCRGAIGIDIGGAKTNVSMLSRRKFLRTAAVMAAGVSAAPRLALGATRKVSPGDKVSVAFVGVGGRGVDNLRDLAGLPDVNVVALCDVDATHLAAAARQYSVPEPSRHRDFRRLLEKEAKHVDAVVISTPDHTHAAATMLALKAGKHVYCEKPLTHTVQEARAIARCARENPGLATQMGNQGMAFEGNRLIKEWIWSGALGDVREVHVWSDRPTHRGGTTLWWPQGMERPADTPPVPPALDWDLWLGPAPRRPYHPAYAPFKWRGWWDFGSWGLGDMGIHNLAPVFSALKLGAPTCVHASSTPAHKETVPLASLVHFEFPARGPLPPVKLHWYDGGLLPERPDELDPDLPLDPEDGILFVGDKGKMLVKGWGGEHPRLLPARRHREFQPPPKTLPRSIGHYQEFIRAIKEGTPTEANFGFAGPLTEAVQLGGVAIRLAGEKLRWNADALEVTGNDDATALLHYPYRSGWAL